VPTYSVTLDVPKELIAYVARLLRAERARRGTRTGTRALTCAKQALFVLAWFRDRPNVTRLGYGFGLSQATAYRYLARASRCWPPRPPTCTRPSNARKP
jgi:hypothetical protein